MANLRLATRHVNWRVARALLVEIHESGALTSREIYSHRSAVARVVLKSRMLSIIAMAISASSVAAQTLPEDECARLEDPEAEIVCLRAALAATRQARSAEDDSRPGEAAPAQSSAARSASAPIRPPAVSPSERPAVAATPELGREQVARPADAPRPASDPEALVDRISDFRVDRNGALIMQLGNGQIWRQVENVDLPLRLDQGEGPQVEITRSGFGGYRMHFPARNRTISVSRIR